MHKITYAEFYITNVCNLACEGCNRFNNYKFTGFQKWEDYADEYKMWAKELELRSIGLLGGEPLLNPTCLEWIVGIRNLWPRPKLKVVTNGFHLNKVDGLYDIVNNDRKVELWVGIHNKQHKKEIYSILNEFMAGPLTIKFNEDDKFMQYAMVTDTNGVSIKVEYNWWFHQGSLIKNADGFTLHSSDPEKAHNNCHMKNCHHFIRGKLYKCGVVALLPEFASQHKLMLSESDSELMYSYSPLGLTDTVERKIEFIKNIENPISQCKFCPEVYNGDRIFSIKKKDI